MITRADLIKALSASGYVVTERSLTDWSQKGMLPSLQSRGMGRSRGRVYFWDDPDVIGQAELICRLLAQKSRTSYVLLRLWFAGYSVPSMPAREAWLRILKHKSSTDVEELQSTLAKLSKTIADSSLLRGKLLHGDLKDAISLVLQGFYLEKPEYDRAMDAGLLRNFLSALTGSPTAGDVAVIDDNQADKLFGLYRQLFAKSNAGQLVEKASEPSLNLANYHLRVIRRAICALAQRTDPTSEGIGPTFSNIMMQIAGPPLALFLLHLIAAGEAHRLNQTADILLELDRNFATEGCAQHSRAQFESPDSGKLDRLINIWREIRISKILNST